MKRSDELLELYLETLDIDLNGAKANLHGWTVEALYKNEKEVGLIAHKGTELHFVSLDKKKSLSRANIISSIKPILEKYGYVTTRVPVFEENHKLRLKLGFKKTWSDNDFSYWALTELPYQKGTKNYE